MDSGEAEKLFYGIYGAGTGAARRFLAPARINIIGEHIDYNGGFVLPAAIEQRSLCIARLNGTDRIRMAGTNTEHRVDIGLSQLAEQQKLPWGAYQCGVIHLLAQAGCNVQGMDMLFDENVPYGSGLSSSAAIEMATAVATARLSDYDADNISLALTAQRAENEYVGMNCGIMDQFASAMGKKGMAMLLDCATLRYRYTPVELESAGLALMVMNTGYPRSLIKSAYNQRRQECDEALRLIRTRMDIQNLCALTPYGYEAVKNVIKDPVIRKRAEHAVYENARTMDAYEALEKSDIESFCRCINASHDSLRDLYEVTGDALDAMVNAARSTDGVKAARMMGAGFGGCALAVVECDKLNAGADSIGAAYSGATGFTPSFYPVMLADGAREI